eukprot:Blabericola_migrator_1__12221@NODE_75_length_15195_cov_183_882866_g67_i0_p3_GENE_NODE_75_length_15195_cov_183_882866_g67_i0NODE_75_length_15195_cov_183_882866_g67_i0_p3_ORF_typecomplete_len552_score86_55zfRING_9/PF13901_6/2_5e21zfRING_9/PF13901_6/0_0052DZR/PF12773_7/0_064DZR/PF12773_7/3_1e02LIM/PF00412_22/30LIM/PF00412_22/83NapB/PF03892_14/1_2e04NapB/PF03892_14/29NapB/PF03892_14/47_NODE_75_length_15195_cov_183_882866_g67_i0951750
MVPSFSDHTMSMVEGSDDLPQTLQPATYYTSRGLFNGAIEEEEDVAAKPLRQATSSSLVTHSGDTDNWPSFRGSTNQHKSFKSQFKQRGSLVMSSPVLYEVDTEEALPLTTTASRFPSDGQPKPLRRLRSCLKQNELTSEDRQLSLLRFFDNGEGVPTSTLSRESPQSDGWPKHSGFSSPDEYGPPIEYGVYFRQYMLANKSLFSPANDVCERCRTPLQPQTLQDMAGRFFSGFLSIGTSKDESDLPLPIFCSYSGKYFCHQCHRGEQWPIPACILAHWDFSCKPVSMPAASFLRAYLNRPAVLYRQIHPAIRKVHPIITTVHTMRKELIGLKDFYLASSKLLETEAVDSDIDSVFSRKSDEECDLRQRHLSISQELGISPSSRLRDPSSERSYRGCVEGINQFCQELAQRSILPLLPGQHWVTSVDGYSLADLLAIEHYRTSALKVDQRSIFFALRLPRWIGCTAPLQTARGCSPRVRPDQIDQSSSTLEAEDPLCSSASSASSISPSTFLNKIRDFIAKWEAHILKCSQCKAALKSRLIKNPMPFSRAL